MIGIINRLGTQQGTATTHFLESRTASAAGFKHSSHSHPGEQRTGIISRLKTQKCTVATHSLESRGQALSSGSNHSKPLQPLTDWSPVHRHLEQA